MDAWIQLSNARVTSLAIYIVPIYDRNHHVGCTVHGYECKTRVIYIFITQSDKHSLFKHVIFIDKSKFQYTVFCLKKQIISWFIKKNICFLNEYFSHSRGQEGVWGGFCINEKLK